MEHVIDASTKVAYRLGDFPLQVAQEFLRCVVLSHIELKIAKLYTSRLSGERCQRVANFLDGGLVGTQRKVHQMSNS
jgi:hypothetical protein